MNIDKADVIKQIQAGGVLPIIRTTSEMLALQAIKAIHAAGLDIFEVTMTVPNAIKIIENLSAELGADVLVGAGTVLDAATAELCIASGAKFIVSPVFDSRIVEKCQNHGVTVIAGAMTVTEILSAWRAGADFVKVFPADALGGAAYLKAVKTVLPEVRLIPTGGVTRETAGDFIKAGASAIGVGSDLVNHELLQKGDLNEIAYRTKTLIKIVKETQQ